MADSIRRGLEEALAYAEGTADTSRYGVDVPENIDVRAIRIKLDMTQEEFAIECREHHHILQLADPRAGLEVREAAIDDRPHDGLHGLRKARPARSEMLANLG